MKTKYLFVALVLSLCSTNSVVAQQLEPTIRMSRFAIVDGMFVCGDGQQLPIRANERILLAQDTGFVFQHTMSVLDEERVVNGHTNHLFGFQHGVVVQYGLDYQNNFSTYHSIDCGETWSRFQTGADIGEVSRQTSIVVKEPNAVRYQAQISWDTANTFNDYPKYRADGKYVNFNGSSSYAYVDPFGFTMRIEGDTDRWYGIRRGDTAWSELGIPGKYDQLRLINDTLLVGLVRTFSESHGLVIRNKDKGEWQEILTIMDENGDPVGDIKITPSSIPEVVANRWYVVADSYKPWLIITDGSDFRVVDFKQRDSSWSEGVKLLSVFGTKVLLHVTGKRAVTNELTRWMVLYDLETAYTLSIVGITNLRTSDPRPVLYQGNIIFGTPIADFGQLMAWNIQRNEWHRVGQIYDRNGELEYPEEFAWVQPWAGGVITHDGHGGVYTSRRNDTTLRAITTDVIPTNGQGDDKFGELQAERRVLLGPFLAWPGRNCVFSGGEWLTKFKVENDFKDDMRYDTVSFAMQTSEGAVYACAHNVYKSTDDGASWDTLEVQVAEDAPLNSVFISSIVAPTTNVLLVGRRGHLVNPETDTASVVTGGLVRSTNGGASWQKVQLPVSDDFVHSVYQDSSGTMWMSTSLITKTTEYSTGYARMLSKFHHDSVHLLRSTDLGASWTLVASHSLRASLVSHCLFSISNGPQGDVAFTTPDAILHSSDNGNSWNNILATGITTTFNSATYDAAGDLWVAANDGIYKLKRPTDVIEQHGTRNTGTRNCADLHFEQQIDAGLTTITISTPDTYNETVFSDVFVVDARGLSVPCKIDYSGNGVAICTISDVATGMYTLVVPHRECVETYSTVIIR